VREEVVEKAGEVVDENRLVRIDTTALDFVPALEEVVEGKREKRGGLAAKSLAHARRGAVNGQQGRSCSACYVQVSTIGRMIVAECVRLVL
jgi:hypothetical protein